MSLSIADRNLLVDGEWLTDKHINAASKLLHNQFPIYSGLQDPPFLAAPDLPFLAAPDLPYRSACRNFIQILNIDNEHWACVSNILSSPGVVEIYDSMPFYSPKSIALQSQVAKIMKTKEKSFMLKHVDVQRQSGASECALFAIAHATALCTGSDPHLTNFIQDELRAHSAWIHV